MVTEVSMTTQSANSVSQEIVAFYYATITVTYWPVNPTGGVGAPISFGWDTVQASPSIRSLALE